MLRIKLQRIGRRNRPCYRIVVMQDRKITSSHSMAQLGTYDPLAPRSTRLALNGEALSAWLSRGAQLSKGLVKVHGRWLNGYYQDNL